MAVACMATVLGVAQAHVAYPATLVAYVAARWGDAASSRVFDWRTRLATSWPQGDAAAQVRAVHQYWNRVPYVDDHTNWRMADYWATPAEMLAVNGGDCEDYAVAKYFSLRELGIAADQLRLLYLMAGAHDAGHIVLAYYAAPGAEPLILDNLRDEPYPLSREYARKIVFSFNEDDLWTRDAGAPSGAATQLRMWRQLLERLGRERAA